MSQVTGCKRAVLVLCLIGILPGIPASAQLFTGFRPVEEPGIYGARVHPGALAPNRRKWYLPQNLYFEYNWRGWEYSTVYGASKAAVIGLGRALAVELAPEIRVNTVCPGHVRGVGMAWRTFHERKTASQSIEGFEEAFAREHVPLQRLQTAEDIAAGFVFLTSDEAREITGASLNIGGGVFMD